MTDGQKFLDEPIRKTVRTYDSIRKIARRGDDYTTGCLLDYNYFKNYYLMTAIDSSKQQALDADPKAIQQINFTGNLNRQKKPFFQIFHKKL